MNGILYDMGDYPAAVKTNEANAIEGDVFEMMNAGEVFKVLDEYEGEEYERQIEKIKMNNGDELEAWVYWYTGGLENKIRISERSYRNHLKIKDSLR